MCLLQSEIWRAINPAYIGGVNDYFVSDQGRIRNHKGRVAVAYVGTGGYSWFSVYPHQFQAHTLIAKVFLPNPEEKPVVNHIDGVKTNNVVGNLEWNTYAENAQHAHDTKLNKSAKAVCQVSLADSEVIQTFTSIKSASKNTGVCYSTIAKVAMKGRGQAGGYFWKYDV